MAELLGKPGYRYLPFEEASMILLARTRVFWLSLGREKSKCPWCRDVLTSALCSTHENNRTA